MFDIGYLDPLGRDYEGQFWGNETLLQSTGRPLGPSGAYWAFPMRVLRFFEGLRSMDPFCLCGVQLMVS